MDDALGPPSAVVRAVSPTNLCTRLLFRVRDCFRNSCQKVDHAQCPPINSCRGYSNRYPIPQRARKAVIPPIGIPPIGIVTCTDKLSGQLDHGRVLAARLWYVIENQETCMLLLVVMLISVAPRTR